MILLSFLHYKTLRKNTFFFLVKYHGQLLFLATLVLLHVQHYTKQDIYFQYFCVLEMSCSVVLI